MTAARYALISVTDKTGVIEFAKGLDALGIQLLSTGGTATILRDAGLKVTDVAALTGHPECLDGRVKTLHPKVHGGILADRSKQTHLQDMERLEFSCIDIVAVNLYDFSGQAKGKEMPISKVIEYVDIGGPAMLRAAAKNHNSVFAVVDPSDYGAVLAALKQPETAAELKTRLAVKVFSTTARYDQMIADDLAYRIAAPRTTPTSKEVAELPTAFALDLQALQTLRYGENSHQKAAWYCKSGAKQGLSAAKILQGKELSYNNLVDLDAAAAIVADLDPIPAITVIKHTNPCGTAAKRGISTKELFATALACDPKCAFGGIVASNVEIDATAAAAMAEIFLECVIAPGYSAEALQIFANKKNLRVVASPVVTNRGRPDEWSMRSISGGILVQTPDTIPMDTNTWLCVSKARPTPAMLAEMKLAMVLSRHVKSNAIVLTRDGHSIGVGAGQMSRVDAANIAIEKARELGHSPSGAVVGSDAFFPFRDTVDLLANVGVAGIVHPGGSLRDQESIDAANEHGIVMMVTHMRHFKH